MCRRRRYCPTPRGPTAQRPKSKFFPAVFSSFRGAEPHARHDASSYPDTSGVETDRSCSEISPSLRRPRSTVRNLLRWLSFGLLGVLQDHILHPLHHHSASVVVPCRRSARVLPPRRVLLTLLLRRPSRAGSWPASAIEEVWGIVFNVIGMDLIKGCRIFDACGSLFCDTRR